MFLLFGPMEIYATSYLVVSTPIQKKKIEANFYSSLKASGVMQCASSLKVLNSILEFIRYFDYRSDYVQ